MSHFFSCKAVFLLWASWVCCMYVHAQVDISHPYLLHRNVTDQQEWTQEEIYGWEKGKPQSDFITKIALAKKFERIGENEMALFWYRWALQSFEATRQGRMAICNYISILYEKSGDYEKAVFFSEKALSYAEGPLEEARLKLNISNVYINTLAFEKALHTLDEIIPVFFEYKDSLALAISYGVKALVNKRMHRYEAALDLNRIAYNYLLSLNMKDSSYLKIKNEIAGRRNTLLNNLADIHIHMKNPDSALFYLHQINLKAVPERQATKAAIYISYGEAYTLKKKYPMAIAHFDKGLHLAEKGNYYHIKSTAYKSMAHLYGMEKKYDKAWAYQKKYIAVYEQITSRENVQKVNQIQNQYILHKKNKEIADHIALVQRQKLQIKQNTTQNYLLLTTIGLSAIIFLTLYKNQQNKNRFLKEKLKNAGNEMLIKQIAATLQGEEQERERVAKELHDSVVSELLACKISMKNLAHVYPILEQSSDFKYLLFQTETLTEKLRNTAHNMLPEKLKDFGLVETVKAFVNHISNHRLYIRFQCVGTVVKLHDPAERIILQMIQELIQNIIKHAKATEALVQITYFDNIMTLTIEDNGEGTHNNHIDNPGMGWRNIKENVALLNGTLDIQSSDYEGTTIMVELPIKQHSDSEFDLLTS